MTRASVGSIEAVCIIMRHLMCVVLSVTYVSVLKQSALYYGGSDLYYVVTYMNSNKFHQQQTWNLLYNFYLNVFIIWSIGNDLTKSMIGSLHF